MSEVMQLIESICQGRDQASEKLLPLVYDELRKLAAARIAQENPGQTLQATALVHEAYLRLVRDDEGPRWDGRAHFFSAAAEAMRRILIERARRNRRPKFGGDRKRVELDDGMLQASQREDEMLAVDEILDELAREDPGDRTVWRANFGRALGSGANDAAAVPEPATCALLIIAAIAFCLPAYRRHFPNVRTALNG